jgi:hypothetical protein
MGAAATSCEGRSKMIGICGAVGDFCTYKKGKGTKKKIKKRIPNTV